MSFLLQAPVQIKEFGAITNVDFSPLAPHNFAVTAFTRVRWLFSCKLCLAVFTSLGSRESWMSICLSFFLLLVSLQIHIYGPFSQEPVKTFTRFKDTAYCGRFRSDGQLLVAGCEDSVVRLFDVSGKVALRMFKGHTKYVSPRVTF